MIHIMYMYMYIHTPYSTYHTYMCMWEAYTDICTPELNTYPMIHHMKRRGKQFVYIVIRSALAAGMPTQRLLFGRVIISRIRITKYLLIFYWLQTNVICIIVQSTIHMCMCCVRLKAANYLLHSRPHPPPLPPSPLLFSIPPQKKKKKIFFLKVGKKERKKKKFPERISEKLI